MSTPSRSENQEGQAACEISTQNRDSHKDQAVDLTLNERVAILLKEYDALRKEAEQSLTLMPEIGKSLGVVVAGALIGANRSLLGKDIVLCAPPVIMAALGAVSHTYAKLEATSRRLMDVEDRVYQMVHEPLLSHETRMNVRRLGRGRYRWMLAALLGTLLYVAITLKLFYRFHDAFPAQSSATWITLYWIFVAMPGIYSLFSGFRIGWQRQHIPRTSLFWLLQPQKNEDEQSSTRSKSSGGVE